MRQPPQTPEAQTPYSQTRCALTRQLRYRARQAEAEAREARAEADAAVAAAQAEVEAAWARTETLYAKIKAERAALSAFIESPAWERDLLIIARDRVRAELIDLSQSKQSCHACGSFGRAFQSRFLQDQIDGLTQAHDLPPAPPLPPADWAVPMGIITRHGRGLDRSWHTEEPAPPKRRSMIW